MSYKAPTCESSPKWQRFSAQIVDQAGIVDEECAETLRGAFSAVPRDLFVDPVDQDRAAQDVSLSIGFGQVGIRPSLLARMYGLIGLRPGMRVLEIGTGSGYGSAVLAAAGTEVYTIEIGGPLAQQTRRNLDSLGFLNVLIRRGDGRRGWAEHAPYDAIVLNITVPEVDAALIAQLKTPGGAIVGAVGDERSQVLTLWEAKESKLAMYQLESCTA